MIVNRVKNRTILYRLLYTLVCVAVGWWLHGRLNPLPYGGAFDNGPTQVLVRSLSKKDISQNKKYIAAIEAINSVDIVPQVSGYLEEILFEDGAYVNKNDKIFVIEQRRYKADLLSAEALVKELRNNYRRIASLHKGKFVADKELDAAESALNRAEAALDLAKLNLEHTEISSPISGYIGKALVTKGNLVGPETPKLARIVQLKPVRAAFSVSDKERAWFMQKAAQTNDFEVDIAMPDGTTQTIKAENLFFGNEVNPDTATIPVFVDLPNDDGVLVPGNYVDIYPRFEAKKDALLVPLTALSEDVNGTYVMTVNDKGIVEQKYIATGEVIDDMQVVKEGLNGDEKVIVQGLQKVRAGAEVIATDAKGNN
ncbi:MAG: efflux RND transporter periplasmic adaptor subunit [Alphaproteobacteria bacterium]|nr:efflux RND transporter periplasmic adaptor subunit [Alphaproteobacteria bacterium]MBQ9234865.1 efflux RND transporter periplasmic adaptor subunit [Alphaproteobacteria bacterium]